MLELERVFGRTGQLVRTWDDLSRPGDFVPVAVLDEPGRGDARTRRRPACFYVQSLVLGEPATGRRCAQRMIRPIEAGGRSVAGAFMHPAARPADDRSADAQRDSESGSSALEGVPLA